MNSGSKRAFRRARRLGPREDLAKAGFQFPGGAFALTVNAGLTRAGLVLHYNAYEVAPYVMGPTEAVVPWKELRPLLRAGLGAR